MSTGWHLFTIVFVLMAGLNTAAFLIWMERRLLALWQDRLGPNRVGPFGLGFRKTAELFC
jgi:NADH-quinone oxidoreductase subunit H